MPCLRNNLPPAWSICDDILDIAESGEIMDNFGHIAQRIGHTKKRSALALLKFVRPLETQIQCLHSDDDLLKSDRKEVREALECIFEVVY